MDTVPAKTIITKNKDTSWFGSDYNMNLYRGCSHGCIYCDRRSACYRVEDFDHVRVKENALMIVRDELRRKVKKGVIGSGAMCDSYNPFEKTELVTRHALELIKGRGHLPEHQGTFSGPCHDDHNHGGRWALRENRTPRHAFLRSVCRHKADDRCRSLYGSGYDALTSVFGGQ